MYKEHPYEEVAHQIYLINNQHQFVGSGIVWELIRPIKSNEFLKSLKDIMKANNIRHTSLVKDEIKRIEKRLRGQRDGWIFLFCQDFNLLN